MYNAQLCSDSQFAQYFALPPATDFHNLRNNRTNGQEVSMVLDNSVGRDTLSGETIQQISGSHNEMASQQVNQSITGDRPASPPYPPNYVYQGRGGYAGRGRESGTGNSWPASDSTPGRGGRGRGIGHGRLPQQRYGDGPVYTSSLENNWDGEDRNKYSAYHATPPNPPNPSRKKAKYHGACHP